MEKKALDYINSRVGKIKNYCLVKNMFNAIEKGDTVVVYGGGHLFETYENLATSMCDTKAFKCPDPKLPTAK